VGEESRRRLRRGHGGSLTAALGGDQRALADLQPGSERVAQEAARRAKKILNPDRRLHETMSRNSSKPRRAASCATRERRGQRDLITIPMRRVPSLRTPVPIK
jgi:hypothetical protein